MIVIPYNEIDYIQSDNKKTIMHLTNGDREVISKNIGKINDEINRKYFVKCCIYIQNEVEFFRTLPRELHLHFATA